MTYKALNRLVAIVMNAKFWRCMLTLTSQDTKTLMQTVRRPGSSSRTSSPFSLVSQLFFQFVETTIQWIVVGIVLIISFITSFFLVSVFMASV